MTTLVGAKRPEHYIELANERPADEASRSLRLPEAFREQPAASDSENEPMPPIIQGVPLTTAPPLALQNVFALPSSTLNPRAG